MIQWVEITIVGYDIREDGYTDRDRRQVLRRYNMPRWQYEERRRTFRWIIARFQYLNPHLHVEQVFCYYSPEGYDLGLWRKINGQKSLISRIENRMKRGREQYVPTLFLPRVEDTPAWKEAEAKLEELRAEVARMETELKPQTP